MRKVLILIMLMLAFVICSPSFADPVIGFPVVLSLTWDNPSSGHNEPERMPIPAPEVSIIGHILYFWGEHDSFTMELYDDSDALVYTTSLNTTASQVPIPNSIVGTYEIHLCTESYYFQGVISL